MQYIINMGCESDFRAGGHLNCLLCVLLILTTYCVYVQNLLSLDHCIGIIGGKPKHSVYFVGFQGQFNTSVSPKGGTGVQHPLFTVFMQHRIASNVCA